MLRVTAIVLACVFGLTVETAGTRAGEDTEVIVFAAASLVVVMPEIESAFEQRNRGIDVKVSYASTAVLARQIAAGAPAAVFASANREWVGYLHERALLRPEQSNPWAHSRLVLVASRAQAMAEIDIEQPQELVRELGDGWLAMADVRSVPAGIYGREALQSLGIWEQVKNRVAMTADIRAALLLAEKGEARLALVYATDALSSQKVQIVASIPDRLHEPVEYLIGRIAGTGGGAADRFFQFLQSEMVAGMLIEAGFDPVLNQNGTATSRSGTDP